MQKVIVTNTSDVSDAEAMLFVSILMKNGKIKTPKGKLGYVASSSWRSNNITVKYLGTTAKGTEKFSVESLRLKGSL